MSPSFRDHYVAVVGTHGVGLARCGSGAATWLGSVGFIAERSAAPALALDTLQRMLAEHGGRRARLKVLVSSHYSRFGLIPWSDQVTTPEELRGYAAACFEETYGKSADTWRLTLSPEPAGQARVAVALPEALLKQLWALAKGSGFRLTSIQPYLMTAFNRFHKRLGERSFLFVVAEPGRSTLLLAREGRWCAVRSLHIADSDEALAALIARECRLHGIGDDAPVAVYLHAPGRNHDAPQVTGVEVLTLDVAEDSITDVLHVMFRAVN